MKKCPTCDKTFEDSMRFCQVDGTALVDDEPAFDPYATMVARPGDVPAAPDPVDSAADEAQAFVSQEEEVPPAPKADNVLDLPEADPLKTMYVSDAELREVIGESKPGSEIVDVPPVEDASPKPERTVEETPVPEPPSFSVPDVP